MAVINLHHLNDTTLWKHLKNGYSGLEEDSDAQRLAHNLEQICEEVIFPP